MENMENIRYILYTSPVDDRKTWKRLDSPMDAQVELNKLLKNPHCLPGKEILILSDGGREISEPVPGHYPTENFIVCWERAGNKHRNWARVNNYIDAARTAQNILKSGGFAAMWNEAQILIREIV